MDKSQSLWDKWKHEPVEPLINTIARNLAESDAAVKDFMERKMGAKEVTEERNATHGDWKAQSYMGNLLKIQMRDGVNWNSLSPSQQEALDMIQTKISRILTGNPNEPDHWKDIEGYAYLARKEIER